ncbi:MAG: hypothetical protein ACI8PZ_006818 [Myxococcota bacterium]|jgi:hypothetical protein
MHIVALALLALVGCDSIPFFATAPSLAETDWAPIVGKLGIYTCDDWSDRFELREDGTFTWKRDRSTDDYDYTEVEGTWTVAEVKDKHVSLSLSGEERSLRQAPDRPAEEPEVSSFSGDIDLAWIDDVPAKGFSQVYKKGGKAGSQGPLTCEKRGETPAMIHKRGSKAGGWVIKGDLVGFYLAKGTPMPGRK